MAIAQHVDFSVALRQPSRAARYDSDSDTFFLDLGEPRASVARPGAYEGSYVHFALDTDELVGVTVLGFFGSFVREYPEAAQALMSAAPHIATNPEADLGSVATELNRILD